MKANRSAAKVAFMLLYSRCLQEKEAVIQGSGRVSEIDAAPRFGNGAALSLPNRSVPIEPLIVLQALRGLEGSNQSIQFVADARQDLIIGVMSERLRAPFKVDVRRSAPKP
jgi:hypothetical protein